MATKFTGITNQVARPAYTRTANLSIQAKFVIPEKGCYGQVFDHKRSKIKFILTYFEQQPSIVVSYNLDYNVFTELYAQAKKAVAFQSEYKILCNLSAAMNQYNPELKYLPGISGMKVIGQAPEKAGPHKGMCKTSSISISWDTDHWDWGISITNGFSYPRNNSTGLYQKGSKLVDAETVSIGISATEMLFQLDSVDRYYQEWSRLPEVVAAFSDGYHAYLDATNQRNSRVEFRGEQFSQTQQYEEIPTQESHSSVETVPEAPASEPAVPTPEPPVKQSKPTVEAVSRKQWPPKAKKVSCTFEGNFMNLESNQAVISAYINGGTQTFPIWFDRIPSRVQDAVDNHQSIDLIVYGNHGQIYFWNVA